jgi:hypothetical protein
MLDHAPLDDEPETEEERRAVAEAHADRERGIEPVSLESVVSEFDSDAHGSRRLRHPWEDDAGGLNAIG